MVAALVLQIQIPMQIMPHHPTLMLTLVSGKFQNFLCHKIPPFMYILGILAKIVRLLVGKKFFLGHRQ